MNDFVHEGVLDIDRVSGDRSLRRVGADIQLLETTTSTLDYTWSSCADGARDGFVVIAEHQSAGRGRMGRRWLSPRGASLLVSVLLIDSDSYPGPSSESLGLIAGIATAGAVVASTGIAARIAWPNDIMVDERKLAGVLVESRVLESGDRACAMGIGINCLQHAKHFPDALRPMSTSLDIETDQPVSREAVAGALLEHLDAWLADPSRWDAPTVGAAFREYAEPFGRRVRLRHKGKRYAGQVVDVDPSAALVVMLDDGVRSVFPVAETTVLRGPDPDGGE